MPTRTRFGLLGDPVSHSLSPTIYRAAFRHFGIQASYEAVLVPRGRPGSLARAMADLAASGGGNVTVPHKLEAAVLVDIGLPASRRTGACNCFWMDEAGRLVGDNTDVGGFLRALRQLEGLDLPGAAVLLLGAGGAARAVAVACGEAGAGSIAVRNRRSDKAREMIHGVGLERTARVVAEGEVRDRSYDLVVNATSLGLSADDPLPLRLDGVDARYAMDLVYGPEGTAWTAHAAGLGIPTCDGLWMLVNQAILSVERWFGPQTDVEGLASKLYRAATTRAEE
jgi:shikimate dehydrogenase